MKFYLNFPWLDISMWVSFQTLLTKECVCQKFWRFCISPRLLHQLGKGNCKKQTIAWTWSKNSGSFSHLVFVSFLSEQRYKCWWFRCVCDSNCVGDIVILGVPWEPYVPEICPLFHITVFLTKYSHFCHILLAPSGALVFIMGYYISNSTAQLVFQIIQILKSLKDPTCAIFFKIKSTLECEEFEKIWKSSRAVLLDI